MIFESYCAEDTFALGKQIGEKAVAGQVYCLSGDLGAGKTLFTQGFASGLGIHEPVSSPTFTIVSEYEGVRFPFYHLDVYRISGIEEMEEIGYSDYFYGDGITIIEWAELIDELLPKKRTSIEILKDLSKGFDFRKIVMKEV